jgi:glycerol uptake facilitator-like aquaporin
MADATTSSESNVARYMAEIVGTFMLVFTIGCVLSEKSQWAAPAAALTCMIMTYAFGAVSGANVVATRLSSCNMASTQRHSSALAFSLGILQASST